MYLSSKPRRYCYLVSLRRQIEYDFSIQYGADSITAAQTIRIHVARSRYIMGIRKCLG